MSSDWIVPWWHSPVMEERFTRRIWKRPRWHDEIHFNEMVFEILQIPLFVWVIAAAYFWILFGMWSSELASSKEVLQSSCTYLFVSGKMLTGWPRGFASTRSDASSATSSPSFFGGQQKLGFEKGSIDQWTNSVEGTCNFPSSLPDLSRQSVKGPTAERAKVLSKLGFSVLQQSVEDDCRILWTMVLLQDGLTILR